MVKKPEVIPATCGICAYFKRTGVVEGQCRFYSTRRYAGSACLAEAGEQTGTPLEENPDTSARESLSWGQGRMNERASDLRVVVALSSAVRDRFASLPPEVVAATMLAATSRREDELVRRPDGIFMSKECWERLNGYSVWVSADGTIIVTRKKSPGEAPDMNQDAAFLQQQLPTATFIGRIPTLAYAVAAAQRLGVDTSSICVRNDRSEPAVFECSEPASPAAGPSWKTDVFGNLAPHAQRLLQQTRARRPAAWMDYMPLMEIAESLAFREDRANAVEAYSVLIEVAPDDVQRSAARAMRGLQFEKLEKYDEAIRDSRVALDLLRACGSETFEKWAYTILVNLGRQCEKHGDRAGAITAFEEIFRAHPRYAIVAENTTVENKLRTLRSRE